ncbi:hypothetical protein [Aquimarina pacifica]|uniref:hypothetical protein n=1 Tax=Aquimarina pacifica TaxID=1296415 RepID=UPI00046F643C|nr:hypothetical protein [Aquimarina pacifica]
MNLEVLKTPFELEDKIQRIDGVFACSNQRSSKSSKKENEKFEKTIGFGIPDEMLELYNYHESINLLWQYRKDGVGLINGRSWLHGPYSFNKGYFNARRTKKKGEKLKGHLWVEGMNTEWINELESRYFILDFICFYSNTFVLLSFSEDPSPKPELTLFIYPNFLFPLKISFQEYVYWVDKVRALDTWMEHFIDKEKCTEEALQQLKIMRSGRFFANMSSVFPEVDLTDFSGNDKTIEPSYPFTSIAVQKNYFEELIAKSEVFFEDKPVEGENKIPYTETWTTEFSLISFVPKPLNIYMVRKIETCIERQLPDSMLAFYSQLNGFRMDWNIPKDSDFCKNYEKEDRDYLFGNFKLYALHEVFGGNKAIDTFHWNRDNWPGAVSDPINMSDEELLFANTCFLIYGSELNNVVIRFEDEEEEPYLYLCEYINGGFFHKLNINFDEFIAFLFENMGLQYWVRFFIEDDEDAREIIRKSPNVPRILEKLNPNANLSKYRNK